MTGRAAIILGGCAMKRLRAARVIIFGVGGVGSWCAEALVRTGLGNLTMVDPDMVSVSNINRQTQATSRTVGLPKVEELRKRLLDINPSASITAVRAYYDEKSSGSFDLAAYDCVIDAIDSVQSKVLLIERCSALGVKLFSSMGAAAKIDPSKIRSGPLSKTRNCPLARNVRKGLRQKNISADFSCVYSEELPAAPPAGSAASPDRAKAKKQANGSLVHITGIFGFTLASMVINDILHTGGDTPPR
ncbi:MAG: tRNA threonylcarbamoyladenosine dehydratase [Spirochaetes bacterium]|nr:tRNA threonylcarbamoyladenosine dehydratase [Spirochaetota bacterium]